MIYNRIMTNKPRFIFAVVSTIIEETLIVIAAVWGLPKLNVHVPVWALAIIMVVWLYYSIFTYKKGTKALKVGQLVGLQNMIGSKGKTSSDLKPDGWVRIRGELWSATSVSGEIKAGKNIIVTGQNRLKLEVRDESIPPDTKTSS